VIRPGWHGYAKPPNFRTDYFCFSLTASGRERLLASDTEGRVFTIGAGLVAELELVGRRFGEAFKERVRDAVASYLGSAPLACCVMCGAAAEAILLALAIEIEGDENRVLLIYRQRDGRNRIVRIPTVQAERPFQFITDFVFGAEP
jgi:hypothetical protein